jgi:hypothetical protein
MAAEIRDGGRNALARLDDFSAEKGTRDGPAAFRNAGPIMSKAVNVAVVALVFAAALAWSDAPASARTHCKGHRSDAWTRCVRRARSEPDPFEAAQSAPPSRQHRSANAPGGFR